MIDKFFSVFEMEPRLPEGRFAFIPSVSIRDAGREITALHFPKRTRVLQEPERSRRSAVKIEGRMGVGSFPSGYRFTRHSPVFITLMRPPSSELKFPKKNCLRIH
jgi:hypothetical protein